MKNKNKRAELADRIQKHAYVGIGIVTIAELNSNPFGDMRKLVFQRAMEDLVQKVTPSKIIIDGNGFFSGFRDIPFECIIKADAKYPCVSAASIIAKALRDALVDKFCEDYPEDAEKYGWNKNQGYPTPQHIKAISQYGITSLHRSSFKPCQL